MKSSVYSVTERGRSGGWKARHPDRHPDRHPERHQTEMLLLTRATVPHLEHNGDQMQSALFYAMPYTKKHGQLCKG